MFDVQCKIDQHDAVFLDDTNEQNDADDCDHTEIVMDRHKQQQRTEASRWQG
jgi:hypothetical protein